MLYLLALPMLANAIVDQMLNTLGRVACDWFGIFMKAACS